MLQTARTDPKRDELIMATVLGVMLLLTILAATGWRTRRCIVIEIPQIQETNDPR